MSTVTENQSQFHLNPRQVANKSDKKILAQAIQMALAVESEAVRHNTQTFNRGRYRATGEIEDYEALKDQARAIKEKAIENLPVLLGRLEQSLRAREAHFYLARDAAEACEYIKQVCQKHRARLIVKAKSMTSEEIKLNHTLEKVGIEIAETDLAEFILQIADEQPSHIVAPAIHRTRERISRLFKEHFGTSEMLETGEDLTKFAREKLREKFLAADIGISGANMIAADSGTLLLVESEGNIRMVTQAPPIHIAVAGIEKIVPTRSDFIPFMELLASSGTGQPLTAYTNIITPPLDIPPFSFGDHKPRQRQFYLVIIDNGRLQMREDPQLKQTLYCVRCSACLNSCANFQAVGGHAFGGETYSGGIGGPWEAATGKLENSRFSELCSGCSRCLPQCPVRIDIPWLNMVLRGRLNQADDKGGLRFIYRNLLPVEGNDRYIPFQKQFWGNYYLLAKWGSRFSPLSNKIANLSLMRILLEKLTGLDRRRHLPPFKRQSLAIQYRFYLKVRSQTDRHENMLKAPRKALLFADAYTSYTNPEPGMAAIKILEFLGIETRLSDLLPDGRASASQGMISTAAKRARVIADYLEKWIAGGWDIIAIEPSVLALFRIDYRHFLDNKEQFDRLRQNCFDPLEYIQQVLQENNLHPGDVFNQNDRSLSQSIFFHGHCQQKTCGAALQTETLLRDLGFKLHVSQVECCGMAGSFGYKKDFYALSMRVGEDLFHQIRDSEKPSEKHVLIASGTSCREQIQAGTGRRVFHPVELLAKLIPQ